MWPYNPYNQFFGGFNPSQGGIGVGGVGSSGVPNWLETIGGIVEDVGGILDVLFPGRSTGSGGTTYPTTTGGGQQTPVPTIDQSLLGQNFAGAGQREQALAAVESSPDTKQKFINFLVAIRVSNEVISRLTGLPTLQWPALLADLLLLWLSRGQPVDAQNQHGQVVAGQVPGSLLTGTGGGNGSSTLPIPGGGIGIPEMGQYAPIAMPATPVQCYRAPKGYVVVRHPQTGQRAYVLKNVARAMGLYKSRRKAPITGREWDAVKKASRYEKKLARMLGDSCNFKVTKKR